MILRLLALGWLVLTLASASLPSESYAVASHESRREVLGAGLGQQEPARQVRELQLALRGLGYHPGAIDGVYGPRTEQAVRALQLRNGLATDGVAGRLTLAALAADVQALQRRVAALAPGARPGLRRGAGFGSLRGSDRVRRLQRLLRRAGYRPGPIDGLFGPRTEAAVIRFQRAQHLRADGVVRPDTLRELRPERRTAEAASSPRPRPQRSAPARPAPEATPASDAAPPATRQLPIVPMVVLVALLGLAVVLFDRAEIAWGRVLRASPAPSPGRADERPAAALEPATAPAGTGAQGPHHALPTLIAGLREAGLAVQVYGKPPRGLAPGIDHAAACVAREALRNVLEHTSARAAELDVAWSPDRLRLTVASSRPPDQGPRTTDDREVDGRMQAHVESPDHRTGDGGLDAGCEWTVHAVLSSQAAVR